MKNLLILLLTVLIGAFTASAALAVPAPGNPVTVKQPDGSQLTLLTRGDERLHWTETTDGYVVRYDENTKWWNYVEIKNGKVSATAFHAWDNKPVPACAATVSLFLKAVRAEVAAGRQAISGNLLVVLKSGITAAEYEADSTVASELIKRRAEAVARASGSLLVKIFEPVKDSSVPPQLLITFLCRPKAGEEAKSVIASLKLQPNVLQVSPERASPLMPRLQPVRP